VYTKVLGMEFIILYIIKKHVFSYEAIEHEIELSKSVLEEYKKTKKKISSSANVLSELDVRKVLFVIELNMLDRFI